MNQGREIDIRRGFDSSKESHLIWRLRTFISDNKKKSLLDLQNKSEFLAGQVGFAEELLNRIDNTKTYRTPLPADKIVTYWYCINCGALDAEEVTYNECCTLCGNHLKSGPLKIKI